MKLRQVQFVVAVFRAESFSQAADQCNATQPTLSNAVSQLEEELGGKLFSRTTRKVDVTPFGRHIMPYLEAILETQSEAVSAASAFHNPEQKLLKIGFSPLVDMGMVTSVTEPFKKLEEDVEVFFKECLLDDLADRIDTGAIDLAILPHDIVPDGLDRLAFYSDALFYLPRHGVAKSSASVMEVDKLPDEPIIMTGGGCGLNKSLEVLFAEAGIQLKPYPGYAMSYPVIAEWTWMGLGAGILPQAKLTGNQGGAHPLVHSNGRNAEFDFFWVWRREAREVAHVAAFLDFIRQKGPTLLSGQLRLVAG